MAETLTFEQGEALLNAINQHIFLVKLHVSWPKMAYQIADAVVTVRTEADNGDTSALQIVKKYRSNPRWQLMPPEWHTRFQRIESKARACLAKASIAFATAGLSTISITRADEIFAQLREYRAAMHEASEEFVAGYTELLPQMRTELANEMNEDLADAALAKLPTPGQLRGKFAMTWAIVPVGGGNTLSPQILTRLQTCSRLLSEINESIDGVELGRDVVNLQRELTSIIRDVNKMPRQMSDEQATDFVREARNQMAKFANEFVENISRAPRERLAESLGHLITSIKEGKNIKTGTLREVAQACQMVRDFAFMQDAELLRLVGTVEQEMTSATAKRVNSDSTFATMLAEAVTPAVDACNDAARAVRNERKFKRIILHKEEEEAAVA